jgi:hypothetical protein
MQVRIDDLEIIPDIIKVTVTCSEPDTEETIGATVEVVAHIKKTSGDHRQISVDAVKQAEHVLRKILELDE